MVASPSRTVTCNDVRLDLQNECMWLKSTSDQRQGLGLCSGFFWLQACAIVHVHEMAIASCITVIWLQQYLTLSVTQ